MDAATVEALLADIETERVERKQSLSNADRVGQAICAYANDLSGSGQPGYVIIGAGDDGSLAGLTVTDELLQKLGGFRSDGKIQPLPTMSVEKVTLPDGEVAVVTVQPSVDPPVRYDGRVWIRVGPRRALASRQEEQLLTEKRLHGQLPFDQRSVLNAPLSELDPDFFRTQYLPNAVARDVLEANARSAEEQLASLRFASPDLQHPTSAGILVAGIDPLAWLPGAYVQFVRFDGTELTSATADHQTISGRLNAQADRVRDLLSTNLHTASAIAGDGRRVDRPDYALDALRELVHNALMHRSYEGTNAPVRINWFADRIEIQNPGGLYGHVRPETLGRASDYRNPVLAEAMKVLGYVERFGVGIARARQLLADNGNPEPDFDCQPDFFQVTVRRAP